MRTIKGDLVKLAMNGEFDVIIHGCNCFCTMGAGIARQIKNTFPEAYESDLKTKNGDYSKLGSYSKAVIGKLTVINAYTQFKYGGEKVLVDYVALHKVFKLIKSDFHGKSIGYPKIGSGLAGGDWNIISKIIEECLEGENHTLVEFD
jgi:O-acetyl-ADP-ribose deacetylase (regulator of RNase III)